MACTGLAASYQKLFSPLLCLLQPKPPPSNNHIHHHCCPQPWTTTLCSPLRVSATALRM